MPNAENLQPGKHKLTKEELSRGGINSGKSRRKRKAFAEAFEVLLQKEFTDRNGNTILGVDAIAAKTFQAAMDGDIRAFTEIRNTVGETPVQRMEVDTIDPQIRSEMDELLGLNE